MINPMINLMPVRQTIRICCNREKVFALHVVENFVRKRNVRHNNRIAKVITCKLINDEQTLECVIEHVGIQALRRV